MIYQTTILTLLTTSALASPTTPPPPRRCVYGTYRCATPPNSIQVCDYNGNWKLDWTCAKGTTCKMLASGGGMLPYCTEPTGPSDGGKCSSPGKYECQGTGAIRVCNAVGEYEKVEDCSGGTKCGILGGVPYCL